MFIVLLFSDRVWRPRGGWIDDSQSGISIIFLQTFGHSKIQIISSLGLGGYVVYRALQVRSEAGEM